MCELFAINSNEKIDRRDYIKEFIKESEFHPHGWGLANLDKDSFSIEKEPIQASKSSYLKQRLTTPIIANNLFFHIRYATIGNLEHRNCHPFTRNDITGRKWVMMHNGTIFDYNKLRKYIYTQDGDTDSERILMYVIDELNIEIEKKGMDLNENERFEFLNNIVLKMSKNNKLNLIFFDGEIMYIHINYANSLYYTKKDNSLIFCTTKITNNDKWIEAPFKQLFACKDGKIIKKGTKHNNEYFDSEENDKFLYQIFSNL